MSYAFPVRFPASTKLAIEQRGDLTIIGRGGLGGKAKDLIEKKEAIEGAGFLFPPSIVLTTEFFNLLYENARLIVGRSRTKQKLLRALVSEDTELGSEQMEILRAIAGPRLWVAVRSSQLEEHGGSGQYFTGFCIDMCPATDRRWRSHGTNYLDLLVKRVVASSGNKDMAVLIQPIVGENNRSLAYPHASGWGYSTRLSSTGEGKICVVNGLGTKAVMLGGDTYFFGANGLRQVEEEPNPLVQYFVDERGVVAENTWFDGAHKELLLQELPVKLKALERLLGVPQYVEFALGEEGIYCLQCADAPALVEEKLDFSNAGKLLAMGATVNGVMNRTLQDIIWASNPWGRGSVAELDLQARQYVLVLPSTIFSDAAKGDYRLKRATIPNVGGIIVYNNHEDRTDAAIGNHIRQAYGNDIPFMVVPDSIFLDRFKPAVTDGDWHLARGKFQFVVNEAVGNGSLRLLE